ncbi:MAG TPA: YceI family protein [Streptosporangiaceae bacterium]|jgi:polyisoprenoid-binding protein YceI
MPDTAAVQIPAAGTYRLDPEASSISFATRHMFGLAGIAGSFRLISGQITITDPLTSSAASAVIDAASFHTGGAARDKDVKSANFLHASEHPQITFTSAQLARDQDRWLLRGQITARGTSAPAELVITEARTDEDGLLVKAATRIDRYAHGLTKKKGLAGRYLDLTITARAARS